jgi:hypothetical protein
MMTGMILGLRTLWNKAWVYVTLAGAFLVLVWQIYAKGKRDERVENERDILREDRRIREESDTIRRDASAEPDPLKRLLSEWTRPGS